MSFLLSLNAKVYVSATPLDKSTAQPDGTNDAQQLFDDDEFEETGNIKNLTLPLTKEEFDISTRGDGGWKLTVATLLSAGINADMVWRPGEAGFDAIMAGGLVNGGEVTLAILDQDQGTEGAQGLVANFNVSEVSRDELLGGALMLKVVLKPSSFPDWYVAPAP